MTDNTAMMENKSSKLTKFAGAALEKMIKFSGKLDPLIEVPLVGDTIADVQDIVYMLDDYYRGNYSKIPMTTMIGCIAIIGYLASPIDLIPDSIPILGMLDDAFIINIILDLCVEVELKKYRKWRKENKIKEETEKV